MYSRGNRKVNVNFNDQCGRKGNKNFASTHSEGQSPKFNFTVYPNPITDRLLIHYDNKDSEVVISSISVIDATGKVVISNKNKKRVNFSSLTPSVYYLKILLSNGEVLNKTIIKE